MPTMNRLFLREVGSFGFPGLYMHDGPISPVSCLLPSVSLGAAGPLARVQQNFLHPMGQYPSVISTMSNPPPLLPAALIVHRRLKYGHKQTCKATRRTLTARVMTTRCDCRPT